MNVTIGKWNTAMPRKKSDASINKNMKKDCKKISTGKINNE
jgi:hypothetical protein